MASSDDEGELVPQSVTGYFFENAKDEPISFSVLPYCFDTTENQDSSKENVSLRGTGDSGCEAVYKEVTEWRLEFEEAHPVIKVHTKDGKWINLLKPRKCYEIVIRTILITTQLLHYLRRNPESSEKSVWEHLRRVFSSFDDAPTINDIVDHYALIKMLVERDDALAKSQFLLMLLKEKPRKNFFGEDLQNDPDSKKSFIVDGDLEDDISKDDGEESEEEPDLFDSVCAICDNGGELLCCEGRCMRSFHATKEDGEDSDCRSLGFSRAQLKVIQNQNFLCSNCKYKRHQCFVCGKLGSSDKSTGAEVFACVNATCGYFYHPKCVSGLLFPENTTEAAECEEKIAGGESFACPVHKCHICKQGENKEVADLQFAVCRRCPRSYHRKCLPRKIAFDEIEEEGILQRAWDDLLPNRILIYCLRHRIDEDLGTPIRNHILFAVSPESRRFVDAQKNKAKALVKKKISGNLSQERTSAKLVKSTTEKLYSSEGRQPAVRNSSTISRQVLNFQKHLKPSKASAEPDWHNADGSLVDGKKSSKGKVNAAVPTTSNAKVVISSFPKIDVETQNEMVAFIKSASSSLTLADITRKLVMPSTHSARNFDRGMTLGKVEGSVEAVKTALKKLEGGGTVEDAKAVCEPDILKQIMRWSNKLKVYLAPFLHGMRYTSYGRHFTKVDKLKEIVDKLQWYVQNGDTIVDFCCGANDFSRIMKEKLDAAGKQCSYKNFDVIQPKYDFNFEKRDWMTVQPNELPTGSQLIMGLNPPFGLKASLANKFIDKALTFKPKLVILIVPSETERLDKKRSGYDLIWEDCEKLSGKSFYLPGSIDVNDMQIEQWNNKPPPLYLWSRPDWTTKHRDIALKQGHIFDEKYEMRPPESRENRAPPVLKQILEEKHELPAQEELFRAAMPLDTIPREENESDKEGKKIVPTDNLDSKKQSRNAKRKAQKRKEAELSEAKRTKLEKEDGVSDTTPKGMPPLQLEERTNPVMVDDIQDIARRYATPSISRDYMVRGSEEKLPGYDYRRFLDVDTSRMPPQAMLPSDPAPLGRNDMFPSYGLSNSNTVGPSVMQRYTPRLDEMSFPSGANDVHGMRGSLPPDTYGFAPGPPRQFPHNSSGGWLDD